MIYYSVVELLIVVLMVFVAFLGLGILTQNHQKISSKASKKIISLSIVSTLTLGKIAVLILEWLNLSKINNKPTNIP